MKLGWCILTSTVGIAFRIDISSLNPRSAFQSSVTMHRDAHKCIMDKYKSFSLFCKFRLAPTLVAMSVRSGSSMKRANKMLYRGRKSNDGRESSFGAASRESRCRGAYCPGDEFPAINRGSAAIPQEAAYTYSGSEGPFPCELPTISRPADA